jgi:adenine-specific DNA-methyltransferase
MEKLNKSAGQSMDIVADNIAKLKELFPEILTENKIDFDTLKALLGEEVETDDERYSFNWHGKAQARQLAQTSSTGTLRPCKEDSIDWEATQNIFIEGDNLEVLKLLQKSYHKQVKMIYIDPPYNTGKDFVYPDNFRDNIKNYLELTGQLESGRKINSNSESGGRFHTDWLNMMYPRLKLARNLLTDDGIIFISIDDSEVSNLKKICDEIFGEENLLQELVWKRHAGGGNDSKYFATDHEYILAYSKNKVAITRLRMPLNDEDKKDYIFQDEHFETLGPFKTKSFSRMRPDDPRPTLTYKINAPDGSSLTDTWKWEQSRFLEALANNQVQLRKDRNGKWQVEYKIYLYSSDQDGDQEEKTKVPRSLLLEVERNSEGKRQLSSLLGADNVFNNPKPLGLIRHLLSFGAGPDSLILDFFAGSGTTAHAVLESNVEDKCNKRFISIQLPEQTDNPDYPTISKITKERIRRAAKKIKADNQDYQGDLGFKVFKLDSSNLKPWDADFDSLAQDLAEATEIVKAERSAEDVLFEILLKYGLDLTLPIATHILEGKTVYEVGAGALVVCLDSGITEAVAEAIGKLKETLEPEVMRVVFKDSGFANDAAKVNAVQVLKQFGIDDVKSI